MDVKLISSDNKVFNVSKEIGRKSELIKNIIEDLDQDIEIPLQQVKSDTLEKVLEYCTHYKDTSFIENKDLENINEWDKSYINVDQETLNDIILAANFMNIPDLLELSCKTVANQLKNKSLDEIREFFGMPENKETENKETENK